jgi:hypothetical protein
MEQLTMHNRPDDQAAGEWHHSVPAEDTSVCRPGDRLHKDLLIPRQNSLATDTDSEDHKDAKLEPGRRSSAPCLAASSAESTARTALPPAKPSKENSKPPELNYPLPPTEIHDGLLFRKVG